MKRISIIKRLFVIALIFLLSINTFAAVVSDNDGAAFISKAEFDTLKNNFQTQLDEYNTTIDSKIDNAIAAYLSAIKPESEIMRGRYCDALTWTFWHSSDYPKYVEGKPYMHGFVFGGNNKKDGATRNVTWAGLEIAGKAAYQANGGFQKHFVDKVGYGSLNGTSHYVAQYSGYYINEGEEIAFGGTNVNDNSGSYALAGENMVGFQTPVNYKNATTPKKISSMQFWANNGTGYCTQFDLTVQTASRIVGTQSDDTNISIYDKISDDRFWDVNVVNKIGITATTPGVTQTVDFDGASTGSSGYIWWTDVAPTLSVKYAAIWMTGGAGNTNYTNSEGRDMWSYNGTWSGYSTTKPTVYLPKLANEPHGLQFNYLWSTYTESAASATRKLYNTTGTSTTVKNNIKAALIYDQAGTEHLSLGAGYPLISVKKDEEISWQIKLPSTSTNDVILFGKYSPFIPNSATPQTEAEVTFTNSTNTNKKLFNVPKDGTSTTVRFKAEQDGIVFFKWMDSANKRTTLDVSSNPRVKLVD